MINTVFNGMLTIMLAHFMFNQVPHAAGILPPSEYAEKRRELVNTYGSWSVGRAESICPLHDDLCVEREASRLLGAYRRGFTS